MDKILQNSLISAASQLEKQLDQQIDKLENIDGDDLQSLREQRLKELKELSKKKQQWLTNGHGVYSELSDEKEFFEVSKISPNIILATKHIEARFCKVNAEKSPFLTQRLRIKVIPTIALIKDSKTKDYIIGFTDLGNCDDFTTEMMEWRIAQSGSIDYNGDLLTPPDRSKKQKATIINQNKKTIRGGYDSDDSDIDFDE